MKASKKTIAKRICLFAAVLCFALAGVSSLTGKTAAYADNPEADFYTMGASIRAAEPTGIRFETKIKKSVYDGVSEKADAKFGTLIIPKAVLGEAELKADTANVAVAEVKNWAADDGEYKKFYGVLTGNEDGEGFLNFAEKHYNVSLVARAFYSYTENGKTEYVYADAVERSVAQVASVALTAGNTDEFVKGIVNSVVDKAAPTAFTADSVIVGNDREIKVKGLENLTPVWEVDGNVITVKNGALSATATGTANVTAKLGDRTVSAEITAYADAESFKVNGGYTIKSTTATCTADGETVFAKDGFTDYVVATPALEHNMQEYTAPGMTGEECTLCHCRVLTVTAETDVPTGYDFAALDNERTIASVKEGETVLEITGLTFNNEDALAFTKNGSGVVNGGNQAVKSYTVTYTDGSVYTVNLTLWSLLIKNEADLRAMKNYVVKKSWKIHTDSELEGQEYRRTFGYFKLLADIEFEDKSPWKKTDAPDYYVEAQGGGVYAYSVIGFHGVFDGNGKTILNFQTSGTPHSGMFNILGTNGVVKNVTMKNVTYNLAAQYPTGIIAGYANGGTIENVNIDGVKVVVSSLVNLKPGSCVGLLVGAVGNYQAISNANNYPKWLTGLNVKNVNINIRGTENFGEEFVDINFFNAFGEADTTAKNIEGFIDEEWTNDIPLRCENVTVQGIDKLYGVSWKKVLDEETVKGYHLYTSFVGVNGATENVIAPQA